MRFDNKSEFKSKCSNSAINDDILRYGCTTGFNSL